MWRNWNPHALLVWLQNVTATVKYCSAILLRVKHRHITWPNNPSPRYVPKGIENICLHKSCAWMFTEAWFIIAKKWKQSKCLSNEDWINKMWYIHTMEYYSAIKRWKKYWSILQYEWILKTLFQWKKPDSKGYIWLSLYEIFRKDKSMGIQSRLVISMGWGRAEGVGSHC